MKTPTNILITGASSGIGAALAAEYARRGAANIFICGRNAERLAEVADEAAAASVAFHQKILDVSDAAAVRAWIEECHAIAPLELIVANAGIGTGNESELEIRAMFATNVGGVVNTVLPALDLKIPQIALVSSMTGYHGLPACPAYSASKACIKAWGAGLRGACARDGVKVSVICPGFVRSRITDRNTCPMPFFMEADKAARIIARGLARNKGLITFPWQMRLIMWLAASLPECISEKILAALPEKN